MTQSNESSDLRKVALIDWDRCNPTELYQIGRKNGLNPNPALVRLDLAKVLIGDVVTRRPPPPEIDSWRDALMAFLLDNWRTVRSQLDCPAKSGDPKSCYQCLDTQVLACLIQNKGSLAQISRRKTEPKQAEIEMTMSTSQLPTLQNTPRNVDAITNMGVFAHRKLAEQLGAEGFPMWSTEIEKSAFITTEPKQRAMRLLDGLQRYDVARGGPPPQTVALPAAAQQPVAAVPQAAQVPQQQFAAPAQMQMPMPMMQPMQMGMQMPAPQAAPAAAAEPPREPSNEATGKGGRKAAAATVDFKPLLEQFGALGQKIDASQQSLAAVGALAKQAADGNAELNKKLEALTVNLAIMQNMQNVMLGLLYSFGQQVLQAPGEAILQDSVGQYQEAMTILSRLLGKAG